MLRLLSGEVILEGKRQWCCRIHSKRQEDFEIRIQEKERVKDVANVGSGLLK